MINLALVAKCCKYLNNREKSDKKQKLSSLWSDCGKLAMQLESDLKNENPQQKEDFHAV